MLGTYKCTLHFSHGMNNTFISSQLKVLVLNSDAAYSTHKKTGILPGELNVENYTDARGLNEQRRNP